MYVCNRIGLIDGRTFAYNMVYNNRLIQYSFVTTTLRFGRLAVK